MALQEEMTRSETAAQPAVRQSRSGTAGVRDADARMGRGLGWISIGLGLAEIVAPQTVAQMIGVQPHPVLLRLLGVREVVSGVGLLTQPEAQGWRWARVAGDALDLALLGGSAVQEGSDRRRIARAAMAVIGVTAVDVAAGVRSRARTAKADRAGLHAVVTIDRSPEECYLAWLDLEILARVMSLVTSIQSTGENRTRWTAEGLNGEPFEWESEYTERTPNERIAWRTLPGSKFQSSGRVTFEPAPGNRGTIVRFEVNLEGGHGLAGRLFGKVKVRKDLHRFKQLLETGTIPTTDGQPAGPRSPIGRLFQQKGEM
jgi:uncharacterized membrane protein